MKFLSRDCDAPTKKVKFVNGRVECHPQPRWFAESQPSRAQKRSTCHHASATFSKWSPPWYFRKRIINTLSDINPHFIEFNYNTFKSFSRWPCAVISQESNDTVTCKHQVTSASVCLCIKKSVLVLVLLRVALHVHKSSSFARRYTYLSVIQFYCDKDEVLRIPFSNIRFR